ncbi:MAG: hypothetical protein RIS34_673 [Pseudomonadota bacterium]|jgi:SAM-dependent methyltransferase
MIVNQHPVGVASDWVKRWSHLIAAGGTVLDVACGQGRHVRWFCASHHPVVGLDRAQDALDSLADLVASGQAQTLLADIENEPWPLMNGQYPRQFEAVVVTNYLWRPLLPTLLASLAPGGVLIYETFASGNESVGKPSRPDFLLQTGELLRVCALLRVVAFEEGFTEAPTRFVQRVVAVRALEQSGLPARYPL